jgi:hypothetical protein
MEIDMSTKQTLTDEQVFGILKTTEDQLRVYMQLQEVHTLAASVDSHAWTPSYSWSDPVGFVMTGPGLNGVVG